MHGRVLALALVSVFFTGCATPPPVVPPQVEFRDHPALGDAAEAEIGETLVLKSKLYVFEGLDLQERITDNGIAREYIIEPHAMRLESKLDDGSLRYKPSFDLYYVNDKSFRRKAYPNGGFLIKRPNGALEMVGAYDFSWAGKIYPANPRHIAGKVVDKAQPNFRQELIYGGRVGNQIKVAYREFSNDMIRPGFTQEVQYDLGPDQTIGFKGVRIEVLSADNTRIKYKVLKSFPNLP